MDLVVDNIIEQTLDHMEGPGSNSSEDSILKRPPEELKTDQQKAEFKHSSAPVNEFKALPHVDISAEMH